MTRMIEASRLTVLPLALAALISAVGCVGEVSDAFTEEQALADASALEEEMAVGVAAMKLLSAQCVRVGQDAGQLGLYDVPVDGNGSQQCWLDRGSAGPAVQALQQALVTCWFQNIEPDGDYGPLTQRAVRNIQSSLGITADGVYGPQTRASMADGFARSGHPSLCAAPLG